MRVSLRHFTLAAVTLGPALFSGIAYAQLNISFLRQYGLHPVNAPRLSVTPGGIYTAGDTYLPGPPYGQIGAYLRKYDFLGNELWSRQFSLKPIMQANGVSSTSEGIYVVGTGADILPNGFSVYDDVFLRKYDADGNEIWTREWNASPCPVDTNGACSFHASSLSATASGVYIVGYQCVEPDCSAFVRKYDLAGNELWTREFGSSTFVSNVSVTAEGVYIVGDTRVPLVGQTMVGQYYDAFLRKYDFDGNEVWTREFGSTTWADAHGVSALTGSVYVVGDVPDYDAYVRKYDSNGNLLWSRQFGSPSSDNAGGVIATADAAFVLGTTNGALPGQTQTGSQDAFVAEYDSNGNSVATLQFGVPGSIYVGGIDASTGTIYMTGTADAAFPGQPTNGVFLAALVTGSSSKPVSRVSPLPVAEPSLSFTVQWSGTSSGTSSIRDYTIYVSDNGGSFTPWLTQTTANTATFTGVSGHSYGFFSIARNWDGNQENAKFAAEAKTVVDITRPTSRISLLAAWQISASFTVQWSGTDTGSGIQDYSVYVSDNGGPFAAWLSQTTANQAVFSAVSGHSYGFYSIARDWAGNAELSKSIAEATTRVDLTKPVSHVLALLATAVSPNFQVQWSGSDTVSGVRDYSLYVSDNNSPFTLWLSQTTATQAWYAGKLGHTYGFFSIARDWAGNIEDLKSTAEAGTQVPAQMATDVNGDGWINCADLAMVKAAIGTRTGQPGYDSRADVNKDGVVDVRDVAAVAQKLAPGTTCP